ncbi:gluconate 2-dehydrogenase subunit 3 family protein [Robiginitalea sp. M366]|uniref:gluconate 2-dehydrogenase subunit 3 family protein n=1 Tax=Robiginitalea aestuariiviva TaxID=3036903 RepID=UPI00240DF973|nr:gluconate 2-dehydrogenase subunit 3 family protein [Robiginitalea aestuariiviva]MDG1570844.1 gluconate 2-dehydrogenase subunit 3 family protein [Robiginitalea aestuariiviva]
MDRRKALKTTGLLAGATLAMPAALSLLQSCQGEAGPSWEPLFFTGAEARLVSALADTLLPRTDTPGALDVKVDIFIDRLLARAYPPEGQQTMREALAGFDQHCQDTAGAVFADLDNEARGQILQAAEQTDGQFGKSVWGTAVGEQQPMGFYRPFKSTVIWAYFSSEEIGENVLSYDPIPGAYRGCVPLSEIGNRWSL